jgi:hypothetical protein
MEFVKGHLIEITSWDLYKSSPKCGISFIISEELDTYLEELQKIGFETLNNKTYFLKSNTNFSVRTIRNSQPKTYPLQGDKVFYYGKLIDVIKLYESDVLSLSDVVLNI